MNANDSKILNDNVDAICDLIIKKFKMTDETTATFLKTRLLNKQTTAPKATRATNTIVLKNDTAESLKGQKLVIMTAIRELMHARNATELPEADIIAHIESEPTMSLLKTKQTGRRIYMFYRPQLVASLHIEVK